MHVCIISHKKWNSFSENHCIVWKFNTINFCQVQNVGTYVQNVFGSKCIFGPGFCKEQIVFLQQRQFLLTALLFCCFCFEVQQIRTYFRKNSIFLWLLVGQHFVKKGNSWLCGKQPAWRLRNEWTFSFLGLSRPQQPASFGASEALFAASHGSSSTPQRLIATIGTENQEKNQGSLCK